MFPITLHPFSGDLPLFHIINNWHSPIWDKIMLVFTDSGEFAIIWLLIAAIIFFTDKKNGRKILTLTLFAVIISSFLNDLFLKSIFFRERPYIFLQDIHHLGNYWANSSFVSGHTSSSFAAFFILGRYCKKWFWLFLLLAIIIAYSRIYVGMHYPSDIIGGIIVGIISALIVLKIDRKALK